MNVSTIKATNMARQDKDFAKRTAKLIIEEYGDALKRLAKE